MAKVGLWLHGARGKLAGATLYKGVGGTQIRQIVDPENPMTEGQAMQRMIFSTVGHAFKYLYPYIQNKWQGATNKKELFKQFARNNLAYIRAGVLAGTIDHCFNIMGANAFAPNEYQVAKGTLNPITPVMLDSFNLNQVGYDGVQIPCSNKEGVLNDEINNYNDYARVLSYFGCKPGDTLTILAMKVLADAPIATYNDAINDRIGIESAFITFKKDFDGSMYQTVFMNDSGSISEDFIAASSNNEIKWFPLNNGNFIVGFAFSGNGEALAAGTIIRSRRRFPNSSFDFSEYSSNSRLLVADVDDDGRWLTGTVNNVLPSYMGITQEVEDQFLNKEVPEYPVYSGAEPIENVQLLITNDGLIQDIEDTIFNGTLNETNNKVNISGKWLVNDDEYPHIVSNTEFDRIVVNGIVFVKNGTGQGRLYYSAEDQNTYFSWYRVVSEGERNELQSQNILLYKDNKVYTLPYDFIVRIYAGDDRDHSGFENSVEIWNGTLFDLYGENELSVPMNILDEQSMALFYIEGPCPYMCCHLKEPSIGKDEWNDWESGLDRDRLHYIFNAEDSQYADWYYYFNYQRWFDCEIGIFENDDFARVKVYERG